MSGKEPRIVKILEAKKQEKKDIIEDMNVWA